ncbi:MAG: hypothetical protein SGJ02_11695 [bacterium]|nr:hypothetical protein [bacterium]
MRVEIKVEGFEKVFAKLEALERKVVDVAYDKALRELGAKIGELSADKVPVEEGILKSTFTVQKIAGGWVCGYNTEYAMYQHQGMRKDGTHIINDRPGGGESFFLSGPVEANQTQLLAFLQERFDFHLLKALN